MFKKFSDINLANFEVIGNDEHIFDSPQVNIPSLSIRNFRLMNIIQVTIT